ncbi:MAG: DUF429 domain-containing protein [Planctomycetaceae bacterium]
MAAAGGRLVLGIDFPSAPRPRKPITAAIGRLVERRGRAVYRLREVRELVTFVDFERLLRTAGPWLGGFDLPIGQPRPLVEHEGWPTTWPAFVRFYCARPRPELRAAFRRWCDARPAGDKFAWRRADRPAGSSPAMRWAHPPVAWMMHAGIGRMLDAGLVFPAHAHPGRRPPTASARVALEAYPAFTVRRVCREPYKSDEPAGRSPERAARRRTIVRALVAGTAGLDVALEVEAAWTRRLVADPAGDLLDAVICALQAGHAALRPRFGLPRDCDPLEGWIASVPPPSAPVVDESGAVE